MNALVDAKKSLCKHNTHSFSLSLRVCSVTVYTYIESNKLYHMEFDTSIREVITPSKDALSVRTAQTVQTQTYVADKAQRK